MISQPTSTEKVGIQTATNALLTHVSEYDNYMYNNYHAPNDFFFIIFFCVDGTKYKRLYAYDNEK